MDEKEISARLGDWLRTGGKLKETMADLLAQQLREDWASERIGENVHDTIRRTWRERWATRSPRRVARLPTRGYRTMSIGLGRSLRRLGAPNT